VEMNSDAPYCQGREVPTSINPRRLFRGVWLPELFEQRSEVSDKATKVYALQQLSRSDSHIIRLCSSEGSNEYESVYADAIGTRILRFNGKVVAAFLAAISSVPTRAIHARTSRHPCLSIITKW
jgi:hypothetical protein